MRIIWAIVAIILVAGVVVVALTSGAGATETTAPTPISERGFKTSTPPAAHQTAPEPAPEEDAADDAEVRKPERRAAIEPPPGSAAPAPKGSALDQLLGLAERPIDQLVPLEEVEAPAPEPEEPARAATTGAPSSAEAPAEVATNDAPASEARSGDAPELLRALGEPEAKPAAGVNEDGALVIDGRFTVPGEGTKEEPYVLTWDLLISANEAYQPRKGMTELPEWAKTLDGKWVRVTGFVAFPIYATNITEILVMKNQWDGCCIGVPPTPYDAVEVRLTERVEGRTHAFNYGTVMGKFRVEPYLQGNWLLGLYLMDDASVQLDM